MAEFTKEEQVQAIYDLKVGYTLGHADIAMLKSMARQLLASMEQEPVYLRPFGDDGETFVACDSDDERAIPLYAAPQLQQPALTVWYGSMPESNGKTNWTAILHRKGEGMLDGITIDRSEYPGRVLYAADRARYLIGEKPDRPFILYYDADKHSGYVAPCKAGGNSPVIPDCSCGTCRPVTFTDSRFVVCSECGNKRCPHANDHRNACTGSNDPGQEGSAYPAAPQQEVTK